MLDFQKITDKKNFQLFFFSRTKTHHRFFHHRPPPSTPPLTTKLIQRPNKVHIESNFVVFLPISKNQKINVPRKFKQQQQQQQKTYKQKHRKRSQLKLIFWNSTTNFRCVTQKQQILQFSRGAESITESTDPLTFFLHFFLLPHISFSCVSRFFYLLLFY